MSPTEDPAQGNDNSLDLELPVLMTQHQDLPGYPDSLWGQVPDPNKLRQTLAEVWVRFHTLPHSAEFDPNSIDQLAQLLDATARIWGFVTDDVGVNGWTAIGVHFPGSIDDCSWNYENQVWDKWFINQACDWRTIVKCDEPPGGTTISPETPESELTALGICEHYAYAPFPTAATAFTEYARNNALYQRYAHTLMHIQSQTLIYVYHSGIDIFCGTVEKRHALATAFPELLPPRCG